MSGRVLGSLRTRRAGGAVAAAAVVAAVAVVAGIASSPAAHSLGLALQRPGGATARTTTARTTTARTTAAGTTAGTAAAVHAPAGWDGVPYRRVQLSVPGRWVVETPGQKFCDPHAAGLIFAGGRPRLSAGQGCHLTASYAWIRPAGHIPAGISHHKPTAVINGIPVYRRPSGPNSLLYLVPELKVRVGAHGPLSRRVLATLTRSPLAVVLGQGAHRAVSPGWAWHRFGNIRFAAPRRWPAHRESRWETCGTGLVPGSLTLIDAVKPPLPLPCPFTLPSAAALAGHPGLTVVTGKYAARSVSEHFTRCQSRGHARVCLAAVTGQGGFFSSVLIVSVSGRQHRPLAFLLIGLSGSGVRARTIFDSIRLG